MSSTARLPFISVVIPTYNRSRLLKATVDSIVAQSYPGDRWELIVVDNGSSDDTVAVIEELSDKHAGVIGLTEPRRGAHFARNSGALASRGDILYFTDDDMLADPGMLAEIVDGFVPGANVGAVTGRVLPKWETEPPVWILEHCRNSLLSLLDLGDNVIVADEDIGVFSCHQAILREAFRLAGGFNPDTNAGEFTGDNETGLNIKVKKLGYRFAYVPGAITRHLIPASRMTQRYLNSRLADQGYCDSYTDYRRLVPGRARLMRRIALHAALTGSTLVRALARRAAGKSAWRLDLARAFYYRNRARYDARLVRHEEWRRFAMRDDWLDDGRLNGGVAGAASVERLGEAISSRAERIPQLPLVTVITVVYNGVHHIEETINAVAGQTYPNIQYIVVDGGSVDGTLEILERHDHVIDRWVSEPDAGLYDAMNKAIKFVSDPSSYIVFAHADDTLHSPDAIEKIVRLGEGADLIYGRMLFVDGGTSAVMGRALKLPDLASETLCHPATFVRRHVFDTVGAFDTSYQVAADYDHIVRCFAYPVSTRFADVIVTRMRMGGLSGNRFLISCRERKRVVRTYFSGLSRLAGVTHVNLYDIPRNTARHWLDRAGLLGHWRALKRS